MTPYDFSVQKAKEAGELIMRLREEHMETTIKEGDPRNIVTSVDLAVSSFLESSIKDAFPGHAIYSEEGAVGPDEGEDLWAMDPIDGTRNFVRGLPHFAVSLCYLKEGVPTAGAVYNPTTGELYSFERGKGAFLNGEPIRVSSITELSHAYIFLHAGRKSDDWEWGGNSYKTLLSRAYKTSNFASSALDICFVAAGRIEAVAYGGLLTMDVAAAFGILEAAGGVSVGRDGEKLRMTLVPERIIAANTNAIIDQLRFLL